MGIHNCCIFKVFGGIFIVLRQHYCPPPLRASFFYSYTRTNTTHSQTWWNADIMVPLGPLGRVAQFPTVWVQLVSDNSNRQHCPTACVLEATTHIQTVVPSCCGTLSTCFFHSVTHSLFPYHFHPSYTLPWGCFPRYYNYLRVISPETFHQQITRKTEEEKRKNEVRRV